jgi:hypothetical protein
MTDQFQNNDSQLTLTPASVAFLNETARWAKFISIVGFVGLGFLVLVGLFAGSIFSMIPQEMDTMGSAGLMKGFGAFFGFMYIGMAILYFFPLYYLFQFSVKIKRAFQTNDIPVLEQSFEYLKSHYKFIGILMAIMLGFYALGLLLMLLFGGLGLMMGS